MKNKKKNSTKDADALIISEEGVRRFLRFLMNPEHECGITAPQTKEKPPAPKGKADFEFKIYQMADVSTGHITEEDGELMMRRDAPFRTAVVDGATGAIFYVQDLGIEGYQEMKKFGFSNAFIAIFKALNKQGIPYVRLDGDGYNVDGAPEFEW